MVGMSTIAVLDRLDKARQALQRGQGEKGEHQTKVEPLDENRHRKGLRWNRISLITFFIVQGIYCAVTVFAVYMMISGWEKVSDFDNNGQPSKRADIPAYHAEVKMPPLTP